MQARQHGSDPNILVQPSETVPHNPFVLTALFLAEGDDAGVAQNHGSAAVQRLGLD